MPPLCADPHGRDGGDALGPVRRKLSSGYGVQRAKVEHDDLAALAEKNGLSLTEVMEKIDI